MTKQVFTVEKDGFNGVWYANPTRSKECKAIRVDIDRRLRQVFRDWLTED